MIEMKDFEQEELDRYQRTILHALNAKPTPYQSDFYVRAAGMTESGVLVLGSNHEYGLTRSIHSEETLVANALEQTGEDDPLSIMAFQSDTTKIPASCGNCRDVIKQYFSPGAKTITGNEKGEILTVNDLSILFFEDFHRANILNDKGVIAAQKAEKKSHDLYIKPEKVYGAAIITEGGIFSGGFEGDIAYHPSLPIRNSITNLIYGSDDERRFSVKELIIAKTWMEPDVPYLERQHFAEFVARVNAFHGKSEPIPVYLVEVDDAVDPITAWRTDSEEWIPHLFFPEVLGMHDQFKASIEKLI